MPQKPLWQCPKCGAWFVSENLWHTCGTFSLEALFARSEPHVFQLFERYAEMVRACGPVIMVPQKTRVVFMVRVRFAGAVPRKAYLRCTFALPRPNPDPRFVKIETYNPRWHGHTLHARSQADLDDQVQAWLCESYAYFGQQKWMEQT